MAEKTKNMLTDYGENLLFLFRREQANRGRDGCECEECTTDMINAVRKLAKRFVIKRRRGRPIGAKP